MTQMIEQSREDALEQAATAPLDPHVIVLFGATGDLAARKLLPGPAASRPVGHDARVPDRRHGAQRADR